MKKQKYKYDTVIYEAAQYFDTFIEKQEFKNRCDNILSDLNLSDL